MTIDLTERVDVKPHKKRTTGRQIHRGNVSADSTSDYYKRAVTIRFLDQLHGQIQSRFSQGNLDALDAMYGMPNYVVFEPNWKENYSQFLSKYEDNLPDLDFLDFELRMWRLKFSNLTDPLPISLQELFLYADRLSFPSIFAGMKIFHTIPVTICSWERPISTLRGLKTFMTSTMGKKRIKGTSTFKRLSRNPF